MIKDEVKNVLIDISIGANLPNLKDRLKEVKLQPEDIHLIILTREHFEHIGVSSFFCDTAVIDSQRLAANKIQLQTSLL